MPMRSILLALLLIIAIVGAVMFLRSGQIDPASPGETVAEAVPRNDARQPQVDIDDASKGERRALPNPDAQITGRLVGADGPLPGVEIELLRMDRKRVVRTAWQGATDPEGRFYASGLPDDRYWPAAHGPTMPPGLEFIMFDLKYDQRIDLGDLEVPVPGALHGRVIDSLGLPLAGVRVYRIHSSRNVYRRFNLAAHPGSADADPNVLTDAQGRFAFANLLPGEHRILADSEHYVEGTAECSIEEGEDRALLDLQLERGAIARGRVFSPDGLPIDGALVMPLRPGDRPNLRRATRTDADGSFILFGLDIAVNIQAQAKGYAFQDADWSTYSDHDGPVLFELQPELTLRGQVKGLGTARGTVQIDPEDLDTLSPSVQKLCWVPLPIERDGSFVIKGLVQGKYEIIASADASGNRRSEPLSFDMLPDMAPLSLTLALQNTLVVMVRDDLGQVLVDAEVFAYPRSFFMDKRYSWPTGKSSIESTIKYSQREGDGGQHLHTDAEGRAFPLEPDESLSIAASHPGHLSAGASFKEGQVPGQIELILPRAARLSGRLDDASEGNFAHLSVVATPLPGQAAELPETAIVTTSVDAQGHYLFAAIRPGRYLLALHRGKHFEMNYITMRGNSIPLLGAGTDTRNVSRVELLPDEHVEVDLKVAPLGSITGHVLMHGRPVAGIHVFEATSRFSSPENQTAPGNIQGREAYGLRPATQTDAEGRFMFAYAKPGSWHLLVQHPDSPVPGKPVAIQAYDYATELEQDLILEAAEVRGQIDLLSIPENRRRHLEVFLVSVDLAKDNPFPMGEGAYRLDRNDSSGQRLEDASFAFPFLREGDWILRLVDSFDDLLLQLQVHTARNQIVDLGMLTLPTTVKFYMQVELPDPTRSAGIWLRKSFDKNRDLVYVRTLYVMDGHLREGFQKGVTLEPGNYQAELFWAYEPSLHSMRLNGKSAEVFATFEVHADGTTTPAKLVFH